MSNMHIDYSHVPLVPSDITGSAGVDLGGTAGVNLGGAAGVNLGGTAAVNLGGTAAVKLDGNLNVGLGDFGLRHTTIKFNLFGWNWLTLFSIEVGP